jgi:hypothetical protein
MFAARRGLCPMAAQEQAVAEKLNARLFEMAPLPVRLPWHMGSATAERSAARLAHPQHRGRAWLRKHHQPRPCCPKVVSDMSAAIWPPIGEAQLADEQAASQARELEWLLVQLRETLQSLKAGLEECAALLAPSENGSTLVLSSVRSESLKGLITRIGTRITKGVRPAALCCSRARY